MKCTVSPVSALALRRSRRHRARPGGLVDLVAEANVRSMPFSRGRLVDVVEDRWPVGDGLGLASRAEAVAEGVHVAVGTDARIAEEVPGAADRVAALEDDVGLPGHLLQVQAGADAGQARADDDHVEMFGVASLASQFRAGPYNSANPPEGGDGPQLFARRDSRSATTVRGWLAANLPGRPAGKGRRLRRTSPARSCCAGTRSCRQEGWIAPHWPKEFGGTGWDVAQRYIFGEELCARTRRSSRPSASSMVARC